MQHKRRNGYGGRDGVRKTETNADTNMEHTRNDYGANEEDAKMGK